MMWSRQRKGHSNSVIPHDCPDAAPPLAPKEPQAWKCTAYQQSELTFSFF